MANLDFSKIEPSADVPSSVEHIESQGLTAIPDNCELPPVSASELQSDHGAISESFSALAETLKETASSLSAGLLPPIEFELAVSELRTRFKIVSANILARVTEMGLDTSSDQPQSLARLRDLISSIQEKESALEVKKRNLEELVATLDCVLTLQRADDREFPSLAACQDAARSLRLQLGQSKYPEIDEKSGMRIQSFQSLLLMVKGGAQIDEEESALAYEAIMREFGVKLAVAVMHGLVIIPDIAEAYPPTTPKDDLTNVSHESIPLLARGSEEPASKELHEFEQPEHHVGEAEQPKIETPLSKGPERPSAADSTPKVQVAAPVKRATEFVQDSAFRYLEGETAKLLAAEVLASPEPFQPSAIQRLVWLSLTEERASTSYNLARCLEMLYPELSLSISSALIRAYALGSAIRTPMGAIAAQLKTDFGVVGSAVDSGSIEQASATHAMLVSASLLPAIIAPDTNASRVLEIGAQKLPRLIHLYELCKWITDYANVKFPLDPAALHYVDSSADWTHQIERLHAEVEDWWAKAPGVAFKFAPAGRVWRKWLEPGGLVAALISPIRSNDLGSMNDLRQFRNRLSTDNKLRAEVNFTDRQLRGRGVGGNITAVALAMIQRHLTQLPRPKAILR
jgi:hypothetical protein